jgi:hypothetical protein
VIDDIFGVLADKSRGAGGTASIRVGFVLQRRDDWIRARAETL